MNKPCAEPLAQAAALVVAFEAQLEGIAPGGCTRTTAALLAEKGRRVNCLLNELDNLCNGTPEPPQCRD